MGWLFCLYVRCLLKSDLAILKWMFGFLKMDFSRVEVDFLLPSFFPSPCCNNFISNNVITNRNITYPSLSLLPMSAS